VISAVVSIGLFSAIAPARPFTELEANICQTTASAAGSMTMAAGLIGPIPALQMLGIEHSVWVMAAWGAAVAYLGVFFAAPLRAHFVVHNADALKFPSGTATAETIKSMFADAGKATSQIRTLVNAAVVASMVTVATWAFPPLLKPPVFAALGLRAASRLGFGLRIDPILLGGGALMGARTGISVLFGAVCAYGVLAPRLARTGDIENGDDPMDMKRGARGTMLWPGGRGDGDGRLRAAHRRACRGASRQEAKEKRREPRERELGARSGAAAESFRRNERALRRRARLWRRRARAKGHGARFGGGRGRAVGRLRRGAPGLRARAAEAGGAGRGSPRSQGGRRRRRRAGDAARALRRGGARDSEMVVDRRFGVVGDAVRLDAERSVRDGGVATSAGVARGGVR